jgi:hypothetical protein
LRSQEAFIALARKRAQAAVTRPAPSAESTLVSLPMPAEPQKKAALPAKPQPTLVA